MCVTVMVSQRKEAQRWCMRARSRARMRWSPLPQLRHHSLQIASPTWRAACAKRSCHSCQAQLPSAVEREVGASHHALKSVLESNTCSMTEHNTPLLTQRFLQRPLARTP